MALYRMDHREYDHARSSNGTSRDVGRRSIGSLWETPHGPERSARMSKRKRLRYRDAGVDIAAADAMVDRIRHAVAPTGSVPSCCWG